MLSIFSARVQSDQALASSWLARTATIGLSTTDIRKNLPIRLYSRLFSGPNDGLYLTAALKPILHSIDKYASISLTMSAVLSVIELSSSALYFSLVKAEGTDLDSLRDSEGAAALGLLTFAGGGGTNLALSDDRGGGGAGTADSGTAGAGVFGNFNLPMGVTLPDLLGQFKL